jgi:hypothetical protein
VLEDALVKC